MVEGRTHKPVIEPDVCRSCGVCVRACPAEIVSEYTKEKESLRAAVYGRMANGPLERGVVPIPPCQEACPIHQDTKGYVSLIAKGKWREAFESIREVNPLPLVCGYICHHPCEEACLRREVDRAIPLRLLKQFAARYGRERTIRAKPGKSRREKILVVGAGPAGLAAAHDLALLGYGVTVAEALPVAGGMLAVGIPEFRLPKDVLRGEIEAISALGVKIRLGWRFRFGKNETGFRKLGFQAAFLATGAHESVGLNVRGEELSGVLSGVEFLRNINLGKAVAIGKKVAVIGGGNVALDVARSAVRLGAEQVDLFYRRSRKEMPAIDEEVDEAIREQVGMHFLASPVRVLGKNGNVTGLECVRMELAGLDATGRAKPIPIKGSNFRATADTVISAVGQRADRNGLGGFEAEKNGTLAVDPETGATSMEGVFGGGDVTTGPGWAVDAIAAGKKGAASIHRYLS